MSISPASRDVVLATFVLYFTSAFVSQLTSWFSRRGLYIIDLEAPFEVPRFLPQGGTFNVGELSYNDYLASESEVQPTYNGIPIHLEPSTSCPRLAKSCAFVQITDRYLFIFVSLLV